MMLMSRAICKDIRTYFYALIKDIDATVSIQNTFFWRGSLGVKLGVKLVTFLHSDWHNMLWVGTVCGCIEYVGVK